MIIYLVDDDSNDRLLSIKTFNDCGFQPICFSNSGSALRAVEYEVPDVIFTDLRMPNFSGLDLVKHVKYNNYPCLVFALTGYELGNVDIIQNTFDGYLKKPLTQEELKKAMGKVHPLKNTIKKDILTDD